MSESNSFRRRASAAAILIAVQACGDDKSPTDPGRQRVPARVTISKNSVVLTAIGDTARLAATV